MKPAKIAVICIAAVSAIGLALVVRAMGSSSGEPTRAAVAAVEAPPMAKVLVAAKDLEPGRRLTDADLAWKDWPVAEVNPVFSTDGTVSNTSLVMEVMKGSTMIARISAEVSRPMP